MSDIRDEGDTITAELLKRLVREEAEAWHEFFQRVFRRRSRRSTAR